MKVGKEIKILPYFLMVRPSDTLQFCALSILGEIMIRFFMFVDMFLLVSFCQTSLQHLMLLISLESARIPPNSYSYMVGSHSQKMGVMCLLCWISKISTVSPQFLRVVLSCTNMHSIAAKFPTDFCFHS